MRVRVISAGASVLAAALCCCSQAPSDPRSSDERARSEAIDAAARNEPLPRLLERWRQLTKASDPIANEAKVMIWLYEDLIAEASRSRDLPSDELLKLTVEQQAEYWIARLQDQRTTQTGDPHIGSPSAIALRLPYEETPAWHLERLGWPALPTLISHLHDVRPTRMRTFLLILPTGLMRYGDFCFNVFRAITLTETAQPPAETHAWGSAWWGKHGSEKPAEYYRRLVEGNLVDPVYAATRLVRLGQENLSVLKAAASKATTNGRYMIFIRIADRLGPDDKEYVESFLSESNGEMVVAAAETLWTRFRSDIGARELARRLASVTKNDAAFLDRSLSLLGRLELDGVADAVAGLIRRGDRDVLGKIAVQSAWAYSYSPVAEAIAADFDDTDLWHLPYDHHDRVCDTAAESFAALALYDRPFPRFAQIEKRDAFIAELKSWWLAHRKSLDWAALRERRAEERRRKK